MVAFLVTRMVQMEANTRIVHNLVANGVSPQAGEPGIGHPNRFIGTLTERGLAWVVEPSQDLMAGCPFYHLFMRLERSNVAFPLS